MKNSIMLAVLGLVLVGCEHRLREESDIHPYVISVIDGCQYLKQTHQFAHKGNRTNSIHIYNNTPTL